MSEQARLVESPARSRWLDRRRLLALVALGVGVVLFLLPTLVDPLLMGPIDTALRAVGLLNPSASSFERGFATVLAVRWLAVVLLLLYVVGVEREPLSSIGIRVPQWRDVGLALLIGGVALCVGGGLYLLVHGPGFDAGTVTGQIMNTLGLKARIHVAVNAAVVEELLFRGLLIERLIRLFGRPWLAGAISFVLFVGGHYLTGSASLAQTLTVDVVGGLALVWLYLLRRNVLLCMMAHAVGDIITVLVA
jgi:membrane protease YdiL (CAAX protease family)